MLRRNAARRRETAVILAGVFACLMRWWMETGLRQTPAHVAGLYETVARGMVSGAAKE